jgi:hypothetical protein
VFWIGLGSRLRLRFNALAVSVGFGQLCFTLPRHGLVFLLLDGRVGDVLRMITNELLRIKQVSLHATGQPASKVRVHLTNPKILCVVLPNPLIKESLPITTETTSTIPILHRLEGPHMVLPTTMSSKTPSMTTERT